LKLNKSFLFIVIFSFVFTGCFTPGQQQIKVTISSTYILEEKSIIDNTENLSDLLEDEIEYTYSENVKDKLFSFYDEWKGVKYKFGGYSKSGIDCSAFVQKALKEHFNLQLPRSTTFQVKVGQTIEKDDLQIGDLVFFKTGKTNHVGIYIEDGKFMHTSRKYGVTISHLDNVYFQKRYWTAKRVLALE